MSMKSMYDHQAQCLKISISDEFIQDNPWVQQPLSAIAQQQQQAAQFGQGALQMSMGGNASTASTASTASPSPLPHGPSISAMVGQHTQQVTDKSVPEALDRDLKAQGADEGTDTLRLARAAVRALRGVSDEVFEAAGVNPKYHKENFTKVIDQIMKGL